MQTMKARRPRRPRAHRARRPTRCRCVAAAHRRDRARDALLHLHERPAHHPRRGSPGACPTQCSDTSSSASSKQVGSAVHKPLPQAMRVAVNVETFCGDVLLLQTGLRQQLRSGWLGARMPHRRLPGGIRARPLRRQRLHAHSRHPSPTKTPLFLGDVLATGYFERPKSPRSRPGDTVAVIGAGPVGLCAMMCASAARAPLTWWRSTWTMPASRLSPQSRGIAQTTLNPLRDRRRGRRARAYRAAEVPTR